MKKTFYLLIFLMWLSANSYGQIKPYTKLSENDSLEIMNKLMNLFYSADKPVSYTRAAVSFGNRLFSIKNNALNANQNNTTVIIFSPSLGYFHKSGFGLTGSANLLNDINGFGINQYALSPSYDLLSSKTISFGISYMHYFVKNKYSPFSSPIQNDIYTSISYKKTWLQPGIAVGYATGEYKEARFKDTVIGGIKRHLYDSVNYNVNAFSLIVSLAHQSIWFDVFDNLDGISLTTTLLANAGSGKTSIYHKTNAVALFNFLTKKGRVQKVLDNKFDMQSIGLSIDINYTIGKLSLQPQLYIDYYLPATDYRRLSQFFVFNIACTF